MFQLLGGILLAIVIIVGAFQAGKAGQYDSGFHEGKEEGHREGAAAAKALCKDATETLVARANEKAAADRLQASLDAREKERLDNEELQRVQTENNAAARRSAATVADLRRRLRNKQAAAAADRVGASGNAAAADPAGPGRADAAKLLLESDERLVDESESAQFEADRFRGLDEWAKKVTTEYARRHPSGIAPTPKKEAP